MKKWISILAGLLVAQLVLALALNMTGQEYGAFVTKEKLLAFDKQKVDRLLIEDNKASVTLDHSTGQWVLPQEGDFPAAQKTVDTVLDKLAGLEKGWPVATTSAASRRFKVAEDEYERKLTLYSGDEVMASLYIGTSPGFRKVHLRPENEESVFVAEFNAWEVDAQTDGWIDKEVLQFSQTELEQVRIAEEVTLRNEKGEMQLEGLGEQESTNLQATKNLIGKLSDLRIESLMSKEESAAYKDKNPDLEILVSLKDDKQLNYQFFKVEGNSHYTLKRSDKDRFFQVSSNIVDSFNEVSREKLIAGNEPQHEAVSEINTNHNETEQN
jgi:hypothetical protein